MVSVMVSVMVSDNQAVSPAWWALFSCRGLCLLLFLFLFLSPSLLKCATLLMPERGTHCAHHARPSFGTFSTEVFLLSLAGFTFVFLVYYLGRFPLYENQVFLIDERPNM